MARPNKVWHRKQTGWWMVKLDGVQTKLVQGPKDEGHRQLAEERLCEIRKLRRLAPEAATARTVDLIDAYLVHVKVNLSPDNLRMSTYYCQLFAEACGRVPARDIKPYHVSRWTDAKFAAGDWNDTSVYNAKRMAFRVFSWAAKEGIIPENPLKGMPRPKPQPRQRAITEGEFDKLYEYAGGPLKDLLLALYHTGARPKELRELLWDQVHDGRLVIKKHKTRKSTGKDRVIFLDAAMRELFARMRGERGGEGGNVFLNTEGEPWTKNALRLQVYRLRKKLGLPEDTVAYLCRHGFGTRAIMNGVNPVVVAELMGHTSLEMVTKVYVHLADKHEHLREQVDRVSPTPTPSAAAPGSARKRAKPVDPKKPGPKPKGQGEG
jgi:integrase